MRELHTHMLFGGSGLGLVAGLCLLLSTAGLSAAGISRGEAVKVTGRVFAETDVSAIERIGDGLFLAADEGRDLQWLVGDAGGGFQTRAAYSLTNGKPVKKPSKGDELDIEAMAHDGEGDLYLIGSHSAKRRLLDEAGKGKAEQRLERFAEIHPEKNRRVLLRLSLDEQGRPTGKPERRSLWRVIKDSKLLKPFSGLPGKENGIDIEGLAFADGKLFVGFRGPLLRDNWVPVLVGDFDGIDKRGELRFLRLDGLGIRSMTSLGRKGLLILAGPVGDGPGGYHLYLWDGRDQLSGKPGKRGRVRHLVELPVKAGHKGEGMTVLSQQGAKVQLLIAYDGAEQGGLQRYDLSL